VKAHHLTTTNNPVAEAHPLFKEARDFALELTKLTEGKQLNAGEIHTLFTNAEQVMTAGGGNRTILGKAGEMAGALGQKIKGLAQALQDTTPIKGVDSMFDDLKQKAAATMGKSTQGASVLRALDAYKQIVQRHPNTSKFFWGVAGVLTGLLAPGVGPVVVLGAMRTIDSLLQDKQLSTSVGNGLQSTGTALGVKALAHAGKAIANTDIPDIHNPFGPHPAPVNPTDVVNPPVNPTDVVNPPVNPTDVVNPPNPSDVIGGGYDYTVKPGDVLSKVAQTHGTDVPTLAKLNPDIANVHKLNPGQVLHMPPAHGVGANPYGSPDTGFLGANRTAAQSINPYHESFKFKAGKGILEGIKLITLPTAYTVDKDYTVQKWALNESLGRPRNSVQLTEAGVMTLFMNLQRIDEAVYNRPGNANDPRAMAKNKATAATNTSTSAGPQGQLPGGNVGGLATGDAPAGNRLDYLAADPEGKFDTKYKGAVSSKLSRGIETGLGRAGNWIKDKWKDATTKVTANGLKRHWQDAGSPTDSDQVAAVLQRLKVPNEVITQLYQQLNFPAPKLASAEPAATAGTQTTANNQQAQQAQGGAADVDYDGLANAMRNAANTDADGNSREFNQNVPLIHQLQRAKDGTGMYAGDAGTGDSVEDRLMGAMGGGQQGGSQQGGSSMAGDGQTTQATNTILPQIARMTGAANADDLITIIDTAMSVLQRSSPNAYREKLAQFRGQSAGQQREKPQDIVKRTKGQGSSKPALGPSKVVANNPGAPTDAERNKFDQRVAQATGTMGESRKRTYGGKYVKESADQKLAREFENFLLKME
jgi:LysM repeat protein